MSDGEPALADLSDLEREVAEAYATGKSYRQISQSLNLDVTDVRDHLQAVYGKLGAASQSELARVLGGDAPSDAARNSGELAANLALELDDAVRRERSLAKVLRIISEQTGQLETVIDAVLDQALEICEAEFGVVFEYVGPMKFRELRSRNIAPAFAQWLAEQGSFEVEATTGLGRVATEMQVINIDDMRSEDIYTSGVALRIATADLGKARSFATIPMISGGALIGAFVVYRTRVHPFDHRALELAQLFADQAVIAIENVRQFRELQTRLEREGATRDILEVISESRDDVQPVLERIARNAGQLCDSPDVGLHLINEARTHSRIACVWGPDKGVFPVGMEFDLSGTTAMATAMREARPVQIADFSQDPRYLAREPGPVKKVEEEGVLTFLSVPLVHEGTALGCINLNRYEVKPFTDAEIALLETFAAQAVIAIENVRQFRELQSRLEREAATREILSVISRSRDDEKPVFDVILENAARLCKSSMARLHLLEEDGQHRRLAAHWGDDLRTLTIGEKMPMGESHPISLSIIEGRVIHIEDIAETELYKNDDPLFRRLVEEEELRTLLTVPLLRDGQGFGCVALSRRERLPFDPEDIELVKTFAAQAVIAIENVRQFRELQTRLEREAATGEILSVISRSRDDDLPVFDTILKNAAELCDAPMALLGLMNDARTNMDVVAHFGAKRDYFDFLRENPPINDPERFLFARAIRDRAPFHVEDVGDPTHQGADLEHRVEAVQNEEMRTILFVPLVANDVSIGCLMVYRRVVDPFAEDQIALLKTFAAQAVIAIENVRQFRQLQKRLEREAATREILQVISQSRDDEKPVFEAILENAARLCNAPLAFLSLATADRREVIIPAHRGTRSEFGSILDGFVEPITRTELVAIRPISDGQVVLEDDIKDDDTYRSGDPRRRQLVDVEGARSVLGVPLIHNGQPVGGIILYRREVEPFTVDDVTLIENFAAQAVIAIENVRQFREVQTRLEREAATREVLEVISRSRDDETPVFDAILENACRLCDTPIGAVMIGHEGGPPQRLVANRGASQATLDLYEDGEYTMDPGTSLAAKAVVERRTIHIEDMAETEWYRQGDPRFRTIVDGGGIRTNMFVPLISEGKGIGCIFVFRREVRPFTEDQIALVETFAAQAVIAIENVRQFHEVQARLEREAATREILEVISRSRDDEAPVFDAIIENACTLCEAPHGFLLLRNPEDTHLILVAANAENSGIVNMVRENPHSMSDPKSLSVEAVKSMQVRQYRDVEALRDYQPPSDQLKAVWQLERMRTLLYVPLKMGDRAIGVLGLYRLEVAEFSDDDIELLQLFADQAVIAIENARQFKALESLNADLSERVEEQVGEIERMGRLKRFLPAAVADTVVSQGSDKLLGSHRALLGVLFCDIRGFTAFCEIAEPEETIEVLQTYHEEMGRLIAEHGGGVDHRMGDGIMVLFNDPLPSDDPAGDAVRLALAMRARMEELCRKWKKLGHRLGFGVGISMGYATVGMVGYEGRYDYTASGTAVNVGSRLCERAEDGEILLSLRAATAIEDDYPTEAVGEIDLKGIREPVGVFRLKALDT